jgi:hypothetical protein
MMTRKGRVAQRMLAVWQTVLRYNWRCSTTTGIGHGVPLAPRISRPTDSQWPIACGSPNHTGNGTRHFRIRDSSAGSAASFCHRGGCICTTRTATQTWGMRKQRISEACMRYAIVGFTSATNGLAAYADVPLREAA